MEASLLSLENEINDPEAVNALCRGMHTFKGNARIIGLKNYESLMHRGEDLITMVRDGGRPLTENIIEASLAIVDFCNDTLEEVAKTIVEPSAEIILSSALGALKTSSTPEVASTKRKVPIDIIIASKNATANGILMRIEVHCPGRVSISIEPLRLVTVFTTTSIPTPRPESSDTSKLVENPGRKIHS